METVIYLESDGVQDEWLTLAEAAKHLKTSKPTLYRWMAEGKLPFYQIAGTGQRRIKRADLEGIMEPGSPARNPKDTLVKESEGTTPEHE